MTRSGPITILGIDPGLSCTGYGVIVVDGSTYRCLDFGGISPPPKATRAEKLMRIHEGLVEIIDKTHPDEVAIEDFIHGFVRAAVAIGEARAAAVLAASRAGLAVELYKPSEVKQWVTSYGRGSKDQVGMMVQSLLGMKEPAQPNDAADALAIALCHAMRRGAAAQIEAASR